MSQPSPRAKELVDIEETKEYMKEFVDPVISKLLTEIVVDKPEKVVQYILDWCKAEREKDPEVIRLREETARRMGRQVDRPVTPPNRGKEGSSYGARNLSYVGTLGGSNAENDEGKKGDDAAPVVLTAAQRREAMLAAAERRNNAGVFGNKNISEEKKQEMALAKKRDAMIGKIRALYQASGKDEPFGLGMAKMEVLQMHLERAKGISSSSVKENAREGAAKNALRL